VNVRAKRESNESQKMICEQKQESVQVTVGSEAGGGDGSSVVGDHPVFRSAAEIRTRDARSRIIISRRELKLLISRRQSQPISITRI